MKALVTGATGFIGFHVALKLLEKGISVRAVARRETDAAALKKSGAETASCDIRDYQSVRKAMEGCAQVYHLAADYRLWAPVPQEMYDINVSGTRNVLQAALDLGVEKVVHTSSVGALAPAKNGTPSDENTPVEMRMMCGDYKKSKFLAERAAEEFARKGLPVVIVNPTTPIGAMDRKPTPTGKVIVDFLNGKMPAYLDTGLNFVDVEDVASAHLLAAEKGRIGEKYILGNTDLTLRKFLGKLGAVSGRRPPSVRLPYMPVLIAAYISEAFSSVTKKPPLIPLAGVKMARNYMFASCNKAKSELGMASSPIEGAIEKAVKWFSENGYVKRKADRKEIQCASSQDSMPR